MLPPKRCSISHAICIMLSSITLLAALAAHEYTTGLCAVSVRSVAGGVARLVVKVAVGVRRAAKIARGVRCAGAAAVLCLHHVGCGAIFGFSRHHRAVDGKHRQGRGAQSWTACRAWRHVWSRARDSLCAGAGLWAARPRCPAAVVPGSRQEARFQPTPAV